MQRLKTRPQFQAVLAGGIVSRTPHFALHRLAFDGPALEAPAVPLASPSGPRPKPLFAARDVFLGAMVPKRWARRAVTRNTIKRQIYTLGGEAGARLPLAAYVVRLRSGFDRKQFISATSEVLKVAVRLELQQLLGRVVAPSAVPAVSAAVPATPAEAA
ncbi:MAG: ribonuclease P protein component [Pseudomonadota bacterium]